MGSPHRSLRPASRSDGPNNTGREPRCPYRRPQLGARRRRVPVSTGPTCRLQVSARGSSRARAVHPVPGRRRRHSRFSHRLPHGGGGAYDALPAAGADRTIAEHAPSPNTSITPAYVLPRETCGDVETCNPRAQLEQSFSPARSVTHAHCRPLRHADWVCSPDLAPPRAVVLGHGGANPG